MIEILIHKQKGTTIKKSLFAHKDINISNEDLHIPLILYHTFGKSE